jgi:predicted GIY-YIG superfamily endonuclease
MPESRKPADAGTVYLLHLDPPVKHARHYVGYTSKGVEQRLEAHRAGRGARLLEVVKEAGGTFRLTRTWPGSRALERAIKDRKNAPKLCPECTPQPLPVTRGRAADARAQPEAAPATADRPEAAPATDVVPEPDPEAWLMPWPARPAGPDAYADLLPVTDELISAWRSEPEPIREAELELEPLIPRLLTRRNSPMGIWKTAPEAAAPAPPGGWFYDKPLPYSLTAKAEAELADAEAELEV